jgi:hypothetical protein
LLFCFLTLAAEPLPLTGNVTPGSVIEQKGCLEDFLLELDIDADAVLLIGADSTTAYIERSALKMVYLHPSGDSWLAYAPSLPPVCNIKNLSEVCIFQSFWHKTLSIDAKNYTPFSWKLAYLEKSANSEKNGYHAIKYLPSPPKTILPDDEEVVISFQDGNSQTLVFQKEKFSFDGYDWYYQNKPINNIVSK